jgi:hypothetical protein
MKDKRKQNPRQRQVISILIVITTMLAFYTLIGLGTTSPSDTLARWLVFASQASVATGLLTFLWRQRLGASIIALSGLLQFIILYALLSRFDAPPLVSMIGALTYTLPYLLGGAMLFRLANTPHEPPKRKTGKRLEETTAEDETLDYDLEENTPKNQRHWHFSLLSCTSLTPAKRISP